MVLQGLDDGWVQRDFLLVDVCGPCKVCGADSARQGFYVSEGICHDLSSYFGLGRFWGGPRLLQQQVLTVVLLTQAKIACGKLLVGLVVVRLSVEFWMQNLLVEA